jgi:purine-binding chemotaxis protein CheW
MTGRAHPEDPRQILEARARALAAPLAAHDDGDTIEVVEFVLSRERYAFEATWVRGVHPLRQLTVLPCTPPHVLGIVNVRGRIVAVIDIRLFFGLPKRGLADLDKVVVLGDAGGGAMEFGVLADAVPGARHVRRDALQAAVPTFTGIRQAYLLGVTKDGLIVLDAPRLLHDEALAVNEQVPG